MAQAPKRGPDLTSPIPPEQDEPGLNAEALAQLILRKGGPSGDPNANPSGGFSYLDNIADVLSGKYGGNYMGVLLDQLTGQEIGKDTGQLFSVAPGYGHDAPYNIPMGVHPPSTASQTDIPALKYLEHLLNRNFAIPTDPGGTEERQRIGRQVSGQSVRRGT